MEANRFDVTSRSLKDLTPSKIEILEERGVNQSWLCLHPVASADPSPHGRDYPHLFKLPLPLPYEAITISKACSSMKM